MSELLSLISEAYRQAPGKTGLALLSFCHEKGLLSFRPRSLWSKEKKIALIEGILQTEHLKEPVIELGVYRGGGTFFLANLLQSINSERTIFAADSFEGLPTPTEEDKASSLQGEVYYVEGMFKETSMELLKFQLQLAEHASRVSLHKGFFENLLVENSPLDKKYSVVIIDPDQYKGCKICLEYFYDRLVPGGRVFVDDYQGPATDGVTLAVDEFLLNKPETILQGGKTMWYFVKQ